MNTNSTKTDSAIASEGRNEFSADNAMSVTANSSETGDRISGDDACDPFSASPSGDFATALERDARNFSARSKAGGSDPQRPLRIIVVDCEYSYDLDRYAGYAVAEGRDGKFDIRWPFHKVAAACWAVLRFDPGADVPAVEELRVVANDEADEPAIVAALFTALLQYPDALVTTWGGEYKDLAVLRRCAAEHEMLLPHQLRDLNPYSTKRLDLCKAVAGCAGTVHLPEYAAASGTPCKPSPSKSVGKLVENGAWLAVRDQCLADVLATSVIGLRHLTANGVIACHPQRSLMVLAEAAAKALPASQFVRNTFAPWVRSQDAASRLKGTVYRAA